MKTYQKYEVYIIDREMHENVLALAEPAKRSDLVLREKDGILTGRIYSVPLELFIRLH